MYSNSITYFAKVAKVKADLLKNHPVSFFIGALMAGAYLAMAITLVFTVGGGIDPAFRPLVMGASFGLALILVIFAGSELFTGHTMYMTMGWLRGTVNGNQVFQAWGASWAGNIAGAAMFAVMLYIGHGALYNESAELLNSVVSAKMNKGPLQLFFLAILCNWLVCLAIWTASRTDNDAAKCILIFWCLFAFFASGFEHSVANMAVFSIALLGDHPDSISVFGALYNLLFVTAGNIVSGSIFMAVGYWAASPKAIEQSPRGQRKVMAVISGAYDLLALGGKFAKKYALLCFGFASSKIANK